jgi:hypothetical protein
MGADWVVGAGFSAFLLALSCSPIVLARALAQIVFGPRTLSIYQELERLCNFDMLASDLAASSCSSAEA